MTLFDAAQIYFDEGLNPLPLKKDKSPKLPVGHPFLYKKIDKLKERFSTCEKIGIACGEVSDGFYCIDFDKHQGQDISIVFNSFIENDFVRHLLSENFLSFYKSPSGGFHCYFKSNLKIPGTVYSKWSDASTMIELRGNGQYVCTFPSIGYEYISGVDMVKLDKIDDGYTENLFDLARSYNQDSDYKEKTNTSERTWPERWDNSTLEGQFNNESASEVKDLLLQSGWKCVALRRHDNVELWQRPGKSERDGISATFGAKFNMFYVFSSNASPFTQNTAYNPFSIYTILKFDGDWKKAKDSLRPERVINEEVEVKKTNEFPITVFPEFIQEYISELNRTLNFHQDFLAAAVIFSVATLCGNKYKLRVKRGWETAPIFWFACVGFPGTIKTHPLKVITKPISKLDAENKLIYDGLMLGYDPDARPRTPKPKFKQILISDYTIEALHHIHEFNKRGLGMYKDELNGFMKDMNKYRKGSDLEFWLESFNNGSYIVNRATKEPLMISDICVNMIGTIQHDVLSQVIEEYSSNGFIDRFLFTSPESKVYELTEEEIDPKYSEKWEDFVRHLNKEFSYIDNISSEIIRMQPEAFKKYQEIDRHYVSLQSDESASQSLKNYLSKMKTYVPRFALILSIMDCMSQHLYIEVTEKHMEGACLIADYFIGTAQETFKVNSKRSEIRKIVNSFRGLTKNESIKKLHDKGFNQTDIGTFFGIARQTVGRILRNS